MDTTGNGQTCSVKVDSQYTYALPGTHINLTCTQWYKYGIVCSLTSYIDINTREPFRVSEGQWKNEPLVRVLCLSFDWHCPPLP